MDITFIQFYFDDPGITPTRYELIGGKGKYVTSKNFTIELQNGFSDVWNICNELGDMLWMEYDLTGETPDIIYENNSHLKCPVNKGKVYISCWYITQIRTVIDWAKSNPNVKFIIGGPAIRFNCLQDYQYPSNIGLTDEKLTDTLNKYKCEWNIELPENLPDRRAILLGYSYDSICYWNKCIFCNFDYPSNHISPDLDCSFLDNIPEHNFKEFIVHLFVPSAPVKLLNYLPEITRRYPNIIIQLFIRSDIQTINALKRILPLCTNPSKTLSFFIGLEFTSNRMLKYINKGITLESYLKLQDLLYQYKIKTATKLLLGWNNLIEYDIIETQNFLNRLNNYADVLLFSVGRYMSVIKSELYKTSKTKNIIPCKNGMFDIGFFEVLDDHQMELNNIIYQELFNYNFRTIVDSWGNPNHWYYHGV